MRCIMDYYAKLECDNNDLCLTIADAINHFIKVSATHFQCKDYNVELKMVEHIPDNVWGIEAYNRGEPSSSGIDTCSGVIYRL